MSYGEKETWPDLLYLVKVKSRDFFDLHGWSFRLGRRCFVEDSFSARRSFSDFLQQKTAVGASNKKSAKSVLRVIND